MSSIKNPSLPLWRIDAGNRTDSATRAMAKKIDQAGNADGKVSLAEIDAFDAKLIATMGSPNYSAWTDPQQDPVKQAAWVEHNGVHYVREAVTQPRSLAADVVLRAVGPQLETLAALWWFGGRPPQ